MGLPAVRQPPAVCSDPSCSRAFPLRVPQLGHLPRYEDLHEVPPYPPAEAPPCPAASSKSAVHARSTCCPYSCPAARRQHGHRLVPTAGTSTPAISVCPRCVCARARLFGDVEAILRWRQSRRWSWHSNCQVYGTVRSGACGTVRTGEGGREGQGCTGHLQQRGWRARRTATAGLPHPPAPRRA